MVTSIQCCPEGRICAADQPKCIPGICGTYGYPCCDTQYQCDEGLGCLNYEVTSYPPIYPVPPPNTTPQTSPITTEQNKTCLECGIGVNPPFVGSSFPPFKPCCNGYDCAGGKCTEVLVVYPKNHTSQTGRTEVKMGPICLTDASNKYIEEMVEDNSWIYFTEVKRPTIIPGIPNYITIGVPVVFVILAAAAIVL